MSQIIWWVRCVQPGVRGPNLVRLQLHFEEYNIIIEEISQTELFIKLHAGICPAVMIFQYSFSHLQQECIFPPVWVDIRYRTIPKFAYLTHLPTLHIIQLLARRGIMGILLKGTSRRQWIAAILCAIEAKKIQHRTGR